MARHHPDGVQRGPTGVRRLVGLLAALVVLLLSTPVAGAVGATRAPAQPAEAAAARPDARPDTVLAAHASTESENGEALKGTLRDPNGDPVEGVDMTVESDGSEVGTATTDAQGAWEVPLPSPGVYSVTLQTDTLPDQWQLRNRGGETLADVEVRPGQPRTVIFPLIPASQAQEEATEAPTSGEDTSGEAPSGEAGTGAEGTSGAPEATDNPAQDTSKSFGARFLQQVLEGIKYGAIIAITAVGLSLVFGTTRLINFAHGELVTIGAIVAYVFSSGWMNLPLVVATIIAVIAGGLVGAGLEAGLWRPMRGRGTGLIQLFIISIGVSLLLRHLILWFFDSRRRQYDQYTVQQAMDLGPVAITPRDLVITLLSLATLLGVAYMLMRTRIGKATRAVADNKDLAEASGIDVNHVIMIVWILGGALAALGGVFYGLTTAVYWDMGFNLLLLMFAGVILGGLGSAFGAVVGSLVVGLVAQISTLWFAVELQNAWALLTLIVVLMVRPQGILGRAERAG